MNGPDLPDDRERQVTRLLQVGLLAVASYGLATLQASLLINGGVAFLVTLIPAALRREYDYTMGVGFVLWLTVAVFLHTVGALGPYRNWPWYDEVAHAVSASLVAGVGYAALRALEEHSSEIAVPGAVRGIFVVVFVLGAGVTWELLEFLASTIARRAGTDSVLVVYGIDDIVTDFVFNAVGAVVLAVLVSDGSLSGLVGFIRGRLADGKS